MRTYYHIDSTQKVFGKHLSAASIDRIIRYSFGVDFYGVLGWKVIQYKLLPLMPMSRYWYKPRDHFDQMDHNNAIETYKSHRAELDEILNDEKFPLPGTEMIFRTLGRSTHAISDIFSHSNFIELLYEYYTEDPAAAEQAKKSGKSVAEHVRDSGPTFAQVLNDAEWSAFREKYIPKLFTFQALPDTGPNCHEERNLDWPTSKGASREKYPGIFEASYQVSIRELTAVVDALFERLKRENPAKYELLTGAYRSAADNGEPGPAAKQAKWWSDFFKVWD